MNKVIYKYPAAGDPEYAMILIHGRGASASDIMTLASLVEDDGIIFAAPNAPSNSWYPYSFLSPIEDNQPYLDNSLEIIAKVFSELKTKGINSENVIMTGFSQGACLALEYTFRNPEKYGGIAAFSGSMISTNPVGNGDFFIGTPVFLGCSEKDPHIPLERVRLTEIVFAGMGANVKTTVFAGSYHGIIDEEIQELKHLMRNLKKK